MGREVIVTSRKGGPHQISHSSISTYTMSCFKLPTTLCHEIETLVRKFWWGQRGDQRKVHGIRWEDLCNHKDQEGMGFKDLIMFNEAMLAKLSWQLRQDDNSLFLDAKESASASYAWRSILHGRDVILKGALWRVGDGKQIKIWGDNWLPTKFQPKPIDPNMPHIVST